MKSHSQTSQILIYFGAVATGIAVIAVGLTAVVSASAGLSQTAAREKTNLELQVESSREIRKALAVKLVTPPLAPITAHIAHAPNSAHERKTVARAQLPEEARTAMAMDQSELGPPRGYRFPFMDRHSASY
jgi:hypothetical protein